MEKKKTISKNRERRMIIGMTELGMKAFDEAFREYVKEKFKDVEKEEINDN